MRKKLVSVREQNAPGCHILIRQFMEQNHNSLLWKTGDAGKLLGKHPGSLRLLFLCHIADFKSNYRHAYSYSIVAGGLLVIS